MCKWCGASFIQSGCVGQCVVFVFHKREIGHVVWGILLPVRMRWSVCCLVFHRRKAIQWYMWCEISFIQ